MEDEKQNDEISLIDLFAILWRRKIMIIVIVVIAAIGVVAYSIISLRLPPEKSYLPDEYTPTASLLINDDRSSGGNLSALLNSNSSLGSLAGLFGVSGSGGSSLNSLAIYLVGSNSMLDSITDE